MATCSQQFFCCLLLAAEVNLAKLIQTNSAKRPIGSMKSTALLTKIAEEHGSFIHNNLFWQEIVKLVSLISKTGSYTSSLSVIRAEKSLRQTGSFRGCLTISGRQRWGTEFCEQPLLGSFETPSCNVLPSTTSHTMVKKTPCLILKNCFTFTRLRQRQSNNLCTSH